MNNTRYWQDELTREGIELRRRLDTRGVEEVLRGSVFVERFVFVTAYIMRKLSEADALTQEVLDFPSPTIVYPCTIPPAPRYWFATSEDGTTWRQPIADHYDLARGRADNLPFKHICNLLVHHFAFDVRMEQGGDGVQLLFNSRDHQDRLWALKLDDYMTLVAEVAHDETVWIDTDIARKDRPVIRRRQHPADW